MKFHGALFNVGPLNNIYSGVHTYSDVLFPFVKELLLYDVQFTWLGITLENKQKNKMADDILGITSGISKHYLGIEKDILKQNVSWDMIDVSEFDFLLCQPRPQNNTIENKILFNLIDKFLYANKPVFVWEQDMFLDNFRSSKYRDNVILLHPALLPPKDIEFKNSHVFPFFTYTIKKYNIEVGPDPEKTIPFIFIGNIYYREDQAIRFFGQMDTTDIEKVIFGSWVRTKKRREFSDQFSSFKFYDSCNHNLAIPLMRKAKTTLHILPNFCMDRGLMTARVFTSQMASCLCFCDEKIYGADQFFPPELLVRNGKDLMSKFYSVTEQSNFLEILNKRATLLKNHTVENRAYEFLTLLRHYVN